MQIIEIYKSIQGESSYGGLPASSCDLRDAICAAPGATANTLSTAASQDHRRSAEEVLRLSRGGLVEITGGEPLLQERELVPLMQRLLDASYTVLIETSGERPLNKCPAVHQDCGREVSGSGEGDTFRMENLAFLSAADEVKFVLDDRTDYEFARDFVRHHGLDRRVKRDLFPCFRKEATGARDGGCPWIRKIWPTGFWPMRSRPWVFRFTSLSGTRR